MTAEVFIDDDAGYEQWLNEHNDGFVLNTRRTPTSAYLKLHRSSCSHIRVLQAGYSRWTTGAYIKVCAETRDELRGWALAHAGGEPDTECYCLAN